MITRTRIIPGTPTRILMGKVDRKQKQWRILRDIAESQAEVEFGLLPLLIPAAAGLIAGGAQVYAQVQAAKAQEKAIKAQAEAARRAQEAKAASATQMMRSLAPILALVVVGGTLVTVLLVKKKRSKQLSSGEA